MSKVEGLRMMQALTNRRKRVAEATEKASKKSSGPNEKVFDSAQLTPEMLQKFNIKRN